MIVIIKTLQVILALAILILVHEFGHFIFAKAFGIRVDKFFLFLYVSGNSLDNLVSSVLRRLKIVIEFDSFDSKK